MADRPSQRPLINVVFFIYHLEEAKSALPSPAARVLTATQLRGTAGSGTACRGHPLPPRNKLLSLSRLRLLDACGMKTKAQQAIPGQQRDAEFKEEDGSSSRSPRAAHGSVTVLALPTEREQPQVAGRLRRGRLHTKTRILLSLSDPDKVKLLLCEQTTFSLWRAVPPLTREHQQRMSSRNPLRL